MPLVARIGIIALLSAASAAQLRATDMKAIENQAKMEFFGKSLLMSHSYVKNKLHFNSTGALVGDSEEGTWTMHGIIHVDDVEVKPNLIRVHGTREVLTLRTERGQLGLQPILLTKHMEVEIEPAGTIASLDDVKQTVGIALHQENLGRKMNEYWRAVAKVTAVDPKTGKLTWEGGGDGIYGYLNDDHPIYFINPPAVMPPKLSHREGADYTKAGSVNRTQGKVFLLVVIDERGYPAIIHLLKDLGDSLDTQTLAATSQRRFEPATRDGKPVAVLDRVNWEATLY